MTNNADQGFEFDDAEKFPERLLLKGKSQDTIKELAEACGWKDELFERKDKADALHNSKAAESTNQAPKAPDEVDSLVQQLEGLNVNKNDE